MRKQKFVQKCEEVQWELGSLSGALALILWGHLGVILDANSTNMLETLEYLRSNPTSVVAYSDYQTISREML